jgi:hypothetical protein
MPVQILTPSSTDTTIAAENFATDIERGRRFEKAGREILVASNIFDQEVLTWLARISR